MASEWFYQVMGKQVGPVSSAELRNLAQRGIVTFDTPVRKGAGRTWVSAQRVRGLFRTPNTASPRIPTVTADLLRKQPADVSRQKPRQPLSSDPQPTPNAPPSGEPSPLTAIGNIDAVCPYCDNRLVKKPGRKAKCPHCANFIHVRTRPLDNQKVLVTVKQMEAINEQWGIVRPKCTLGQPVAAGKVNLISSRVFTNWEGITEAMSAKLGEILTDGLAQGRHPREVARTVTKALGIPSERAFTIAHTEIMRCHCQGQLDAMEDMGVTGLGVAVECSTAGDDRVCEQCAPLQGIVLTTKEACGLLPRHEECRCCWTPANLGEDTKAQKRNKKAIDEAINRSIRAEIPETSKRTLADQKARSSWRGATVTIAKTRPKSIL